MRSLINIRSPAAWTALTAGFLLVILTLASPAGAWSPAVVSIAAANSTSAALLDDGTVWQWGYYQGSAWNTPHRIDISGVRQISAGPRHILALKSDGTVWAWGSNDHGQLGDGTYENRASPVQAVNLSGATAIAAGKDHSLALKADGSVWAWGYNDYGQLGGGSWNATGSPAPTPVSGLNDIKAISAGGSHCLALQGNGTAWAWGENSRGVLGDGTGEARLSPVKSKLADVRAFDAGMSHALAVKPDGSVWAWGYNYMGQLGKGGTSIRDQGRTSLVPEADDYVPGMVQGIQDARAVAAGGVHSVALKGDGTVWAWGSNGDGQLGQGTPGGKDATSPAQVKGIDNATAVAAGMYHTLALKADGSVWAWGSNEHGQIGDGSTSSTASPVLVLMGSQTPPPASPTPVIATIQPPAATTPVTSGADYLLAGAICLLAVAAISAVAYLLLGRKAKGEKEKEKGKKGL